MTSAFKILASSNSVSTPVEQNPDSFNFNNLNNVGPSSTATSNQITITGLTANAPVTVSVNVGEVDAGTSTLSGVWESSKEVTVSASGTIVVRPRRQASSSYYATTSQTVTVGSGSDSWTNRTVDVDLIPSVFSDDGGNTSAPVALYTFAQGSIQGLTPNANYYLTRLENTVDYEVAAGTTSVGAFTSNQVRTPFTTSASGTAVFQAKVAVPYHWLYGNVSFYIESAYSLDQNLSYISLNNVATTADLSTNISLSQSAPAGTAVDWIVTIGNLPVSTVGVDSISIYDSVGFFNIPSEGISLTSGATTFSGGVFISAPVSATEVFYVRVIAPTTVGATANRFVTVDPNKSGSTVIGQGQLTFSVLAT